MFARSSRGRSYNNFRGSTRKNPTSKPLRGIFADGVWHCDCKPRVPAARFQVKKEGQNKGRWFFTCQQDQDKRCGFFLWADEAQRRATGAVLSNSRTEPRPRERMSANVYVASSATGQLDGEYPETDESTASEEPEPSPSRRKADSRHTGTKRTAQMAGLGHGEALNDDFPLDAADAEALVDNADALRLETPVKAKQNAAYATPATTAKKRKLPWHQEIDAPIPAPPALRSTIDELPTPAKTPRGMEAAIIAREEAPTPVRGAAATPKAEKEELAAPQKTQVAVTTPEGPVSADPGSPAPPQRFYNALADPDDSNSLLVAEVLTELAGSHIPPEAMTKMRSILSRHELKTTGILKGRDIAREALKKKDEAIKALHKRIQSLEHELNQRKAWTTTDKATDLRR